MTFDEIWPIVSPYSLLTRDRMQVIYDLAMECNDRPGDVAELGVYRGGVTGLLAAVMPNKRIHAFDTFSGLPDASDEDIHQNGEFDAGGVPSFLGQWSNIVYHVGVFPWTAPPDQKYCLAHFDGDTYASCKAFAEYFGPRTSVMVYDDFDWHKTPGVTKAVSERFPVVSVLARYQCVVRTEVGHV